MRRYILRVVGKPGEDWQKSAISEYLKRLKPYAKVELIELPEGSGGAKKPDEQKTVAKEGAALIGGIPDSSRVIALDETGKNVSSEDFAKLIENEAAAGTPVVFLIGGSWGLSDEVRESADHVLSFGKQTLPHILARVVLLEQLYRAETILKGKTYHK
jgi:23S rRNA (pseudouridine1915-N3)-methyltransferase